MNHEEFKATANKYCNMAVRLGLITGQELLALDGAPAETWDAFWTELHKRFAAYNAKRREVPLNIRGFSG